MSRNKYRIGILSMQGATEEHAGQLRDLGHEPILIKNKEMLENVDGLIIPGGESTAIWRLMKKNNLIEAVQQFAQLKSRSLEPVQVLCFLVKVRWKQKNQ